MKKKTATLAAWDYKDPSGESLLNAIRELGLFAYEAPSYEGSDTFGYIVSTKKLTSKEVKKCDNEGVI